MDKALSSELHAELAELMAESDRLLAAQNMVRDRIAEVLSALAGRRVDGPARESIYSPPPPRLHPGREVGTAMLSINLPPKS